MTNNILRATLIDNDGPILILTVENSGVFETTAFHAKQRGGFWEFDPSKPALNWYGYTGSNRSSAVEMHDAAVKELCK